MRVRIYRPTKNAMQSRAACDGLWVVEPVLTARRDKDPFTGWTSAEDAFSALHRRLVFKTSGEALTFARARGWDFEVIRPNERRIVPRNYTDNFNPDRRRIGR